MSAVLEELHKTRPRSGFIRFSVVFFALLLLAPLLTFFVGFAELAKPQRQANVARFFGELVPYSLRDKPSGITDYAEWYFQMWEKSGAYAMGITFAMSLVAIMLAGLIAFFLSPFAARTLMNRDPYLTQGASAGPWQILTWLSRALLMFMRAIPEYIWAFIFLVLFGPSAWPAVLALALHNAGVLGRLQAETIENLNPTPLRSLRALGASRFRLFFAAIAPMSFSRFLLFFFARWEMCVRESTVLGLIGIVSLGYYIQDARARNFYDEMLFFILLGALLVVIGDVLSTVLRRYLRRD